MFIPSSMGHEKSRVNQRGPPRKAKYSWMSDSEQVPRGKGEREPLTGSEIEHEIISWQAVGEFLNLTACLWKNEPATRRQWLVKEAQSVARAKASLNRAIMVTVYGPEPRRSNHGQTEL